MKITNNPSTSNSVLPTQSTSTSAAPSSEKTTDAVTTSSDGYTPSAEFQRLLDQVRDQPDVRFDRILEVTKRLASGEYSTLASAEKTADAILKAGPSL